MSHTRDDKSAQEVCYTPEGEHDHVAPVGHTSLSVPNEAPVLYRSAYQSASNQEHKKTKRIPPRRIGLCGGGIRGIAHVGVMKALSEEGFLPNIKEVAGISAGAFFALLWVLDYTVAQIEQLSLEFDFAILRNIEPETVLSFPLTFGLDEGQALEKFIGSILKQKGFSPDATFEQVAAKHTKHLRCFATELQRLKIHEFSTTKTPTTSVKFAIRASMSLPLFYTPVKDMTTGALLVDGGVLNNLPLVFLKDSELFESWGVLFTKEQKTTIEPIENVIEVFKYIYDSCTSVKNLPNIEKYKDRLICIPTGDYNPLHFEETREKKMELIERAYRAAKKFIYSSPTSRKSQRRFSAA